MLEAVYEFSPDGAGADIQREIAFVKAAFDFVVEIHLRGHHGRLRGFQTIGVAVRTDVFESLGARGNVAKLGLPRLMGFHHDITLPALDLQPFATGQGIALGIRLGKPFAGKSLVFCGLFRLSLLPRNSGQRRIACL